ncbi:MAG: lytic transglycosylase domain-containing protein [Treponema sp.]|nr:lytic transglycosylase domain-containing protein [Treponema sp.]
MRTVVSLLIFCSTLFLCSCHSPNTLGADIYYYQALHSIEANDEETAISLFKKAHKKGSYYVARRSAEALTHLGNVTQRNQACLDLIAQYGDEDAKLQACNELLQNNEFATIIQITDDIDIAESNNKLIGIRITSLNQKKDTRYQDTIFQWYTKRPISPEHYKFYTTYLKGASPTVLTLDQQLVITFRIEIYKRSYINAYEHMSSILTILQNDGTISLTKQIISDMGKAALYGSMLYYKNAQFFDQIAENAEITGDTQTAYYGWFYAARLYEKGNSYISLATKRYLSAMENAHTDKDYDNSLWYLINMELGVSPKSAIESIQKYRTTWHDPLYFSDLFETLSVLLLSNHNWDAFYSVFQIIKGYADDGTAAKYAYLSGRLIDLGLANSSGNPKEESYAAYKLALNSGSDTYYKLLAAHQLELTGDDLQSVIQTTHIISPFEQDTDMEALLTGYATMGFPDYIFPEWQFFISKDKKLTLECATKLSQFIKDYQDPFQKNYAQSLRIIARAINNCNTTLNQNALTLMYPRNYQELVIKACQTYQLPEYLLYALIRSESYFDPTIKSSAGANGLTQLMESTAADISDRLHFPDYVLTNPEHNITFGAYYLHSLIQRMDNCPILAAFAYNSGITRVRSWYKDAHLEIGASDKLPKDIFLETIPYPETREYGRKIVSASIAYGYLYYNKTVKEIITELF